VFNDMADRFGDEIVDVFEVLNSPSPLSLQLQTGIQIDFQQGVIKVSNSRLGTCSTLSGKKIRESTWK